jgi:hypothetical protein
LSAKQPLQSLESQEKRKYEKLRSHMGKITLPTPSGPLHKESKKNSKGKTLFIKNYI